MRVRRFGKSYAHPLIVLVAMPSEEDQIRFAVTAGKSLGNAVQRNRAKRLLREALRPLLPEVKPGWNVILISRQPLLAASLPEIRDAIKTLMKRAHLIAIGTK